MSVASEEIVEIDLEDIRKAQPATVMSEKRLREEVDELRARIRQDFPDDSEFGFDEEQVQEPQEVNKEVSVEPQLSEGVKLESVYSEGAEDEQEELVEVKVVESPGSPGSLLEVSEIEDRERVEGELGELEGEPEEPEEGKTEEGKTEEQSKASNVQKLSEPSIVQESEAGNVQEEPGQAPSPSDPNTILSCFSVPVKIYSPEIPGTLLYGTQGIVARAPNKDSSLEQIFEVLRNHYPDLPAEKELYLCMPQLDLRLGEDNIYCKDTTLVDLIRLLDTCDEYPDHLRVDLEYHDRFISKLNALFDVLNDQPPAKRHRLG